MSGRDRGLFPISTLRGEAREHVGKRTESKGASAGIPPLSVEITLALL